MLQRFALLLGEINGQQWASMLEVVAAEDRHQGRRGSDAKVGIDGDTASDPHFGREGEANSGWEGKGTVNGKSNAH